MFCWWSCHSLPGAVERRGTLLADRNGNPGQQHILGPTCCPLPTQSENTLHSHRPCSAIMCKHRHRIDKYRDTLGLLANQTARKVKPPTTEKRVSAIWRTARVIISLLCTAPVCKHDVVHIIGSIYVTHLIGNDSVPKIIINNTINSFFKLQSTSS